MLWILVGLIVITLAVSAIAAVKLRTTMQAVARCREWKPVTGQVIASSIREVSVHNVGTQYIPIVVYRYVIDDTEYTGERLAIGVNIQYSRRRNAERRVAPHKTGQAVQVRVDPSNPANSVLECRAPIIPVLWTMLVVTWIIFFVGLGLLLTPGLDGPEPLLRL